MAARRPACASQHETGVILRADVNRPGRLARQPLRLEVALQTQILISLHEHLVVYRAVRVVAGSATFANGFVLENERSTLRGVALHARILLDSQRSSAAFDYGPFVRIMAITARDFAILDRMMVRRFKLRFLVQVTLEARFRIAPWIYNRVAGAATFVVHASRTVARFTTHLLRIRSLGQQPRMIGGVKILGDVLMALLTRLTADKRRSLDMRRNNDGALHGGAGDHRRNRCDSQHAGHDGQTREFSPGWWVDVVHKFYGLKCGVLIRMAP